MEQIKQQVSDYGDLLFLLKYKNLYVPYCKLSLYFSLKRLPSL
jgi:hypothetical protein